MNSENSATNKQLETTSEEHCLYIGARAKKKKQQNNRIQ